MNQVRCFGIGSKINLLKLKIKDVFNKHLTDNEEDQINQLLGLTDKLFVSKENDRLVKGLIKFAEGNGIKVVNDIDTNYESFNSNDEVHVSNKPIACILAHEIGHAIAFKGKGGVPAKLSYKLYGLYGLIDWMYNYGLVPLLSFKLALSGVPAVGAVAAFLPFLFYSPTLHQERAATKIALNLLKNLGASDEYLKLSKKSLGAAYRTYKQGTPIFASITTLIATIAPLTLFSETSTQIRLYSESITKEKLVNILHTVEHFVLMWFGGGTLGTVVSTSVASKFVYDFIHGKITIENLSKVMKGSSYVLATTHSIYSAFLNTTLLKFITWGIWKIGLVAVPVVLPITYIYLFMGLQATLSFFIVKHEFRQIVADMIQANMKLDVSQLRELVGKHLPELE